MFNIKISFLLLAATYILLLNPISALAVSGTCSWHGGVNCGEGPDADNSVICNDGWSESAVTYQSQCKNDDKYKCSPSELENIVNKYQLKERINELKNLISDFNRDNNEYTSQLDSINKQIQNLGSSCWISQSCQLESKILASNAYKIAQLSNTLNQYTQSKALLLDNEIMQLQSLIMSECNAIALKNKIEESKKSIEKSQEIKISACPPNSLYNGKTCECNIGYFANKEKKFCILKNDRCKEDFGEYSYYNENANICSCLSGYSLNNPSIKCIYDASSVNKNIFNKNLKINQTGTEVTKLQDFLEKKGYLKIPKNTKKGVFGKQTETALKKFQKDQSIKQTGKLDDETRKIINKL